MHITLEIDEEAKALYIRVREGDIIRTIEYPEQQEIFLDLDDKNQLLGIEVLDPSSIDMESVLRDLANLYDTEDFSPIIKKSLIKLVV